MVGNVASWRCEDLFGQGQSGIDRSAKVLFGNCKGNQLAKVFLVRLRFFYFLVTREASPLSLFWAKRWASNDWAGWASNDWVLGQQLSQHDWVLGQQ